VCHLRALVGSDMPTVFRHLSLFRVAGTIPIVQVLGEGSVPIGPTLNTLVFPGGTPPEVLRQLQSLGG
jgi:hypothetical protein